MKHWKDKKRWDFKNYAWLSKYKVWQPDIDELFLVCNFFDHKNWPEDDNALLLYGNNEVTTVFEHFRQVLEQAGVYLDSALREFTDLKLHIKRNSQRYRN